MAKSKNHTAHNQSYKAHRNPVKKVKMGRHPSQKGVDAKRLLNVKMSRKRNKSAVKQRQTHERRLAHGKKSTRPALI